jgi:hypothetical protein
VSFADTYFDEYKTAHLTAASVGVNDKFSIQKRSTEWFGTFLIMWKEKTINMEVLIASVYLGQN